MPGDSSVVDVLRQQNGLIYCASKKAIIAATIAYREATGDCADPKGLAAAMVAAHSKDLGLDRSVCLRDLVDAPERARHVDA